MFRKAVTIQTRLSQNQNNIPSRAIAFSNNKSRKQGTIMENSNPSKPPSKFNFLEEPKNSRDELNFIFF
jgi:hypothetical protein